MIWLKVILLFITIISVRPGLFGENYSTLGIITCGLALFLHLIEKSVVRKLEISNYFKVIVILLCVYWMYLLTQSAFLSSPLILDVAKGFITCIFILLSFAFMLSDEKLRVSFCRLFIRLMILVTCSYAITLILAVFIPLQSLQIFHIYINENVKNIYFPFTPIYGVMTVEGHVFQRFLGFFRESGISQAFMIWAYVSLDKYRLNRRLNKILLISGIVFTFSTAGIGIFIATIVLKMLFEGKKIRSIVVIPTIYVCLMYAPFIGIADKLVTHSTSITDRTSSMLTSLEIFRNNLMGVGLGNSPISEHSGINIIASLHMIGIIGLFLILLFFFYPISYVQDKKYYLVAISPFFLTALLSQPIVDSPGLYIMILLCIGESKGEPLLSSHGNRLTDSIKAKQKVTLF
ncbi:hypothetical protein BVG16_07010 [Paenibacillus selenitireducens]|uniref:Uncharacterized protein n=2 Tax=Paenibacillus selenitireducens TaxID=1324314 RepID=A0A1T2XKS2_9BACL|nr:hypothetical protein BVG16_07010 [Paenibacillus selenitireducens]